MLALDLLQSHTRDTVDGQGGRPCGLIPVHDDLSPEAFLHESID